MSSPSPKMFGKYELVEELGRGGMAEVWKAKIRGIAGFERTLVIKRVLPQLVKDEEFIAMFVREAQVCSMLNHANIVQVFELGDLDGEYYLAMEYVRGHDLHATLRSRPKELLPPGLAALIGRDVGRALGYAHSARDEAGQPLRIIHRDISPSNVMLGIDGNIKLVDFGVAKAMALASAGLTSPGAVKGKLSYMAPEQITAGAIDHRTDLFAVGIVVHEALTGRRLFKGDTDQQTVERILSAPVFAPSMLNPAVSRELDAVVLRALQRDPAKRYQSGEALAAAFEVCVHQLKFGPTQVSQLLRERFADDGSLRVNAAISDLLPAQVDSFLGGATALSGPFDPYEPSESEVSLSPAPHTPSEVRALRRSAPFVHDVDHMGAWTGDTAPSLDGERISARSDSDQDITGMMSPAEVASSEDAIAAGVETRDEELDDAARALLDPRADAEAEAAEGSPTSTLPAGRLALGGLALVLIVAGLVWRYRAARPLTVEQLADRQAQRVAAQRVAAQPVAATVVPLQPPTAIIAQPTSRTPAQLDDPALAPPSTHGSHRSHGGRPAAQHEAKSKEEPPPQPPTPAQPQTQKPAQKPKPALDRKDVLDPF